MGVKAPGSAKTTTLLPRSPLSTSLRSVEGREMIAMVTLEEIARGNVLELEWVVSAKCIIAHSAYEGDILRHGGSFRERHGCEEERG